MHAFFKAAVPVNSNTTSGAVQIQSKKMKGKTLERRQNAHYFL